MSVPCEFVEEITKLTQRAEITDNRLAQLEKNSQVLHDLATSIAVLVEQMKNMKTELSTTNNNVTDIKKDIDLIKQRPAKRWEKVIEAIIAGIVGIVLGLVFGGHI